MKKYRCTICGYIYDEAKEKVKFKDLPDDWKCPLCGAPKNLFEEIKEESEEKTLENNDLDSSLIDEELRELTNYEIAFILSNLARGCDKQYLKEESSLFRELALYYENKEENENGSLDDVLKKIDTDINNFEKANKVFSKYEDRGAKRVINWASKSTNIMKVVINTYKDKGIDYLKNTKIWVCDICGFVYIGDTPPKVCPVCKVPSIKIWRYVKMEKKSERHAYRDLNICTKDCLCLFVCPTGATDNETGQIDFDKCIGCGACAAACPSKAISMLPRVYPKQKVKEQAVINELLTLADSKISQIKILKNLVDEAKSEEEKKLLKALIHANKVMIEDMMREAGYMLPQSSNTNKLLRSLKNKDNTNIIDKLLEKIEVND